MNYDLDRALEQIENGDPLPLDLTARLIEQGLDVEALIEIHSP